MANQEHLKILKQGVEKWNQWRKGQGATRPDLSGADLSGTDLRGIHFNASYLSMADFTNAQLNNSNFFLADLSGVNFSGADLGRAYLNTAYLGGADLSGANLSEAIVGWTEFGDRDLRKVKGLETIRHEGPSPLSINTIYLSQGNIPEAFLRGIGLQESFLAYMRSLVGKPIDFYSCFISYSSKDQTFAERLYADLQSKGVRCWFSAEDLKIGDDYHQRIDESIRLYDKLVLILSEHAIQSVWVEREVVAAREKEDQGQRPVLFPLRLDDAVMQTTKAWAADVRRRWHIGDFTQWKQHDLYQKALQRLLHDLKTSPRG